MRGGLLGCRERLELHPVRGRNRVGRDGGDLGHRMHELRSRRLVRRRRVELYPVRGRNCVGRAGRNVIGCVCGLRRWHLRGCQRLELHGVLCRHVLVGGNLKLHSMRGWNRIACAGGNVIGCVCGLRRWHLQLRRRHCLRKLRRGRLLRLGHLLLHALVDARCRPD